jgi:hypothetical protein
VSQFASWPALFAIQVDVGPGHGQAPGQQIDRILAPGAAEDVDAGHLGVLARRLAQGQVQHGAHVVLELRRHGALHGPMARIVGPGRDLVDQQPPVGGPEELHRQHPHGADDLRHPLPQRGGVLHDLGGQPARDEDLPAHPAHLRRLDRRPGRHLARGPPGHHDGQLGLQRDHLLDQDGAGQVGHHLGHPGPVVDHPHAPAVVAAPDGLEHDRPSLLLGERPDIGHGPVLGAGRLELHHHVGRHGDAVVAQDAAHG